jgi:sterol 3beta-glucosyltransferase
MEYIHVTGYWFLPNAEQANADWTPPDSLTSFIARARASKTPLVYIGFGSIVVSDPEGLTKTIVDAVQQAGVYAIISKGWSDRALAKDASAEAKKAKAVQDEKDLGTLPDKIYNIDSIPHDWLFPRVDAVCHHG